MSAIRWHQPLPRWGRPVCVLFGLTNVGGAIAQWSEMTLPGVVVGATWALFGWKGLPLIASLPQGSAERPVNIGGGLKAIQRRRIIAFVVPFAWLPLAALFLPQVPKQFLATAFFLSAMPVLAFLFRYLLSACPRCRHHFFIDDRLFRASLTRCVHCGLSLRDGSGL